MRPPRALFAIGLGLTAEGMRSNLAASIALTVVKPRDMPLVMYGLCVASGLNPLYTIVALVCSAVPTEGVHYRVSPQVLRLIRLGDGS
jgi:predicted permease